MDSFLDKIKKYKELANVIKIAKINHPYLRVVGRGLVTIEKPKF